MKTMRRQKRQRAESRAGMVVTTVALDAAVHHQLRLMALERHTVLTELVREAVTQWLRHHDRGHRGNKGH